LGLKNKKSPPPVINPQRFIHPDAIPFFCQAMDLDMLENNPKQRPNLPYSQKQETPQIKLSN